MQINLPTVGPILGYTLPTQCRIWFRAQFEAAGESSYYRCFGLLRYRKKNTPAWSKPLVNKMSPTFDMTCVLSPLDLEPETEYEYQVGWFQLEAEMEHVEALDESFFEWHDEYYSFRSATAQQQLKRSYVVGSCRYLLKIFGMELYDDRGDKTFKSILAQHQQNAIDGLLMIGDQIYADDLNFFAPDKKLPELLRRYRASFSQKYIRKLMATVPTYMILDDHEIEDNWPAKANEKDRTMLYPNAIHAYQIYQCSHSPLFDVDVFGRIEGILPKFWYTFSDGCVDWFVMDSRTERVITKGQRSMVKAEQLNALLDWLGKGAGRVKMIVTSVPFVPDLNDDAEDKWGGFTRQRDQILNYLASNPVKKVVFVSGDVHCAFTAKITMKGRAEPLAYQIVSSSFFWPYPHMHKNDFIVDKPLLTSVANNPYSASITSPVHSDDNFARLDISTNGVEVSFFGRKGEPLSNKTYLQF